MGVNTAIMALESVWNARQSYLLAFSMQLALPHSPHRVPRRFSSRLSQSENTDTPLCPSRVRRASTPLVFGFRTRDPVSLET